MLTGSISSCVIEFLAQSMISLVWNMAISRFCGSLPSPRKSMSSLSNSLIFLFSQLRDVTKQWQITLGSQLFVPDYLGNEHGGPSRGAWRR